jgi:hypothetical protein
MRMSIADRPTVRDYLRWPEGAAPRFLVTVDTEEEFDWAMPLHREGHGLETIAALGTFQRFCEDFGIVPVFLVDHPIATSPETAAVLGPAIMSGRAEIGIHLHPWVNPPFVEDLNESNSFAGNLPEALEREKMRRLRDAIIDHLGVVPLIYRAGRYGAGPHTAGILREMGVPIDSSVRSLFDYAEMGGPNFRDHPLQPYWLAREASIIELPVTSVYTGLLRQRGHAIYPRLKHSPWLRSPLARARLLERIPLTPEGVSAVEATRAIDVALTEGLPLLVLSFHSPSLAPGHTPYVNDARDLEQFYDWWRQVFTLLAKRGALATSVSELVVKLALA